MKFITTNEDAVYVNDIKTKRKKLDAGAFLGSLETLSGREAVPIGKPNTLGFKFMLESHFSDQKDSWDKPEFLKRFCIVGDNIATDIRFGKNTGIGTVLVLSGLTKADEDRE